MRISLVPMIDLAAIKDPAVLEPIHLLIFRECGGVAPDKAFRIPRHWALESHKRPWAETSALRALFHEVPDAHASVWVTWS